MKRRNTMINIKETVNAILATKDVQFKEFQTDEKTGTMTLTTPVNDEFVRGVIVVENERIAIGSQGPDKSGTIITSFQPVSMELIDKIVKVKEEAAPVVEKEVKLAKEKVA